MVVSARGQELGREQKLFSQFDNPDEDRMRRKRRKQSTNNAESGEDSSQDEEETLVSALDRVDFEDQLLEQKLELLKKQLEQLESGILPEFQKRVKKIEQKKCDWLKMINLRFEHEVQWLERQVAKDRANIEQELSERKQELKETLQADIEEQKRRIDSEIHSMEIAQNGHSVKPVQRKPNLRRRTAEPPPTVDKRRKANGPNQIVFRLAEDDIDEDLKTLSRFSGNKTLARRAAFQLQSAASSFTGPPPGVSNGYAHTAISASASAGLFTRQQAIALNGGSGQDGASDRFEARIDSAGKRLYYEKRWYFEGQSVFIDESNKNRRAGVIASVAPNEVTIKIQGSNQRLKVSVRHLNLGRYTIRKRA